MGGEEVTAVRLSRDEWCMVQEALDEYFYVVEHSEPGGVRRGTKMRNAARRQRLLATLPLIDAAIADQAGVGPLFGR